MRERSVAVGVSPSGHTPGVACETHNFDHYALLYGDLDQYLAGAREFLTQGQARDEGLMVAVPGSKIGPLREVLNGSAAGVRFVDMSALGRNPGRIIPEVLDWVEHQGNRRCRFIGEPIWAGRTDREVIEATRHEALINLAFADAEVAILCPYDVSALDPQVLLDAERTHPHLIWGRDHRDSARYGDPVDLWVSPEWSLPEPEQTMAAVSLGNDLASVREITARCAREAGLRERSVSDIVLAVDEAATNAMVHGAPPAELRMWRSGDRLVCEIADRGRLGDPLAGRRRPAPDWPSGRGLWLINQLCDLVELRPVLGGTTIRLHVDVQA
jgi:anti-sigma regulatory factor (Ser/Thr protein kinase)